MRIRAAVPADLDRISAIFREASLSNDGDRANLLAHPEFLEFEPAAVVEGRTMVADDGEVVGFATLTGSGDCLELEDLFVDPRRRREGIATALMAAVVERVRMARASELEVVANGHALDFYRAVGFVDAGMRETTFGPARRLVLKVAPPTE
jgi:GNAT superfamily N-acetyltransferase